jgi:transcription initiation factor IIE alpha subunit
MSDYCAEATLPLFAMRAPSNGSITSAKAADSLDAMTLNAMHRRVLELLAATPDGLTDEEMQRRLEMNPSTQRPRRIELARRGLVVECGTRRTASGRMAVVWKATAASR